MKILPNVAYNVSVPKLSAVIRFLMASSNIILKILLKIVNEAHVMHSRWKKFCWHIYPIAYRRIGIIIVILIIFSKILQ